MKEWKARQSAYHLTASLFKDDLNNIETVWRPDTVVEDALRHFEEYVDEWIYPAKSYVVAICYAYWLGKDFKEPFFQALNDDELLFNNDPHFVPYWHDEETYDAILDKMNFDQTKGMVPDIYEYYKEEMLYGL
jgi:hypothetical protein|tara:strand:- start:697 stop:1095 length:399 start_codon:yes stop_codon:yes gene_type:complete